MAVTLINSISSIPGSPTAGDIVRFSAAITAGIPSTVKKANGTTRETAIVVGSEYRYIGTNWLKIGGDEIVTTPLKDATVLASSEFEDMIMGAVHNDQNSGRLRQFGASLLHQALQAANPLELTIETDVIFAQDIATAGTYNLSIESGSTRYSFVDYQLLVIEIATSQTVNPTTSMILAKEWNDVYDSSRQVLISTGTAQVSTYKVSDTSFYSSVHNNVSVQRIVGLKINFALETP